LPAEAHPSQWVGDQAARFIRESATTARPWCLFASFIHPHPPFAPPKPWHKLYRSPDMPLPFMPADCAQYHTWINRHQNRYKHRDRGFDLHFLRTVKAYYYAVISFVDFQIGRIRKTLDETGQTDDTLILFASDHGEHLGDFGCFGKRSMHDASVRVPLLARLPGRFPAGRVCSTAVSLCDVFPTALGVADVSLEGLKPDGMDLAEIVATPNPKRFVYSQFERGGKAVYLAANERWKYVYSAGDDAEFFFDRKTDPTEVVNLAYKAEAARPKEIVKENLLTYLESTGMTDADERTAGKFNWRSYPRLNQDYLRDPNANLLFQDYPSYPTNLPGYS
jgi:arylsulfatase A-like enzyme